MSQKSQHDAGDYEDKLYLYFKDDRKMADKIRKARIDRQKKPDQAYRHLLDVGISQNELPAPEDVFGGNSISVEPQSPGSEDSVGEVLPTEETTAQEEDVSVNVVEPDPQGKKKEELDLAWVLYHGLKAYGSHKTLAPTTKEDRNFQSLNLYARALQDIHILLPDYYKLVGKNDERLAEAYRRLGLPTEVPQPIAVAISLEEAMKVLSTATMAQVLEVSAELRDPCLELLCKAEALNAFSQEEKVADIPNLDVSSLSEPDPESIPDVDEDALSDPEETSQNPAVSAVEPTSEPSVVKVKAVAIRPQFFDWIEFWLSLALGAWLMYHFQINFFGVVLSLVITIVLELLIAFNFVVHLFSDAIAPDRIKIGKRVIHHRSLRFVAWFVLSLLAFLIIGVMVINFGDRVSGAISALQPQVELPERPQPVIVPSTEQPTALPTATSTPTSTSVSTQDPFGPPPQGL